MMFSKKMMVLFGILIVAVVVLEWVTPRPLNWAQSFSKDDKIPYGSFLVFELLPDLFPDSELIATRRTIYEVVYESDVVGIDGETFTYSPANYIFINNDFSPDNESLDALFSLARDGSSIFIAAHFFDAALRDSLNIATAYSYSFRDHDPNAATTTIDFTNPQLAHADDGYEFKKPLVDTYFSAVDSQRVVCLGTDNLQNPNFIRMPYGAGEFLLHTAPLIFTNYHALEREQADYLFTALSYLPRQKTVWDEHYKIGRELVRTPLRYVLRQPSLSWAYYLTIIGVALFIIFQGRRRQRIIPVIKPLTNTTLDFVRTVGRLYYQQKDHKNIAQKKITYFLAFLRRHYYLDTNVFDSEFYQRLATKSGVPRKDVRDLFELIQRIQNKHQIYQHELQRLTQQINTFYDMPSAGLARPQGALLSPLDQNERHAEVTYRD